MIYKKTVGMSSATSLLNALRDNIFYNCRNAFVKASEMTGYSPAGLVLLG